MKTNCSIFFMSARFSPGRWFVLTVLLWVAAVRAAEPTFTDVTASVLPGLTPIGFGSVAWADYDNDGRLDFLLTGDYSTGGDGTGVASELWRNTGSGFANVTAAVAPGLAGVDQSSVAWGDYDNDGWLDLLVTGSHTSKLWRNAGGSFTDVTATVAPGLPGVQGSSVAWGDFDNDGRLDFLLTGITYGNNWSLIYIAQLWRNTGGGFTNVTSTLAPGLPGVFWGSVAWGDYDNDGWLDFLLTGVSHYEPMPESDSESIIDTVAQVWRNTGRGFSNVTAQVAPGLPAADDSIVWLTPAGYNSSVAWSDFDNDGRLDFFLTGSGNSQLWRNTGSGFSNVTATVAPGLPGLDYSSVSWGDYDNDGRHDFLLTGFWNYPTNRYISQLWRNTGSGFTEATSSVVPGLAAVANASATWADYNNDGRLDFLLSGAVDLGCDVCEPAVVCQLWRNDTAVTNRPPSAPTGLAMTATPDAVMLSWNSATDDQTPASGLTYNVRAGTTPGGNNLLSAQVNATNGFRRVPALGNAMLRHHLPLVGVTHGATIYWSVQAVDTAFAGGPFASETNGIALGQSVFSNVTATVAPGLPTLFDPVLAWGDYDNDGRLDFLITGYFEDNELGEVSVSQLWRNTGSTFTNVTATAAPGLPGITRGSVAWGDYDNDGWLDLLISGQLWGSLVGPGTGVSQIWRNTGGALTNVTAAVAPGLPQLGYSAVAWGDYDNDGRLDFLFTGSDDGAQQSDLSQLWRNTGSGFSNMTATVAPGLPAGSYSAVAWGDYDNDGWLDFLIMGFGTNQFFQLWRNTGKAFTNVTATVAPGLPQVEIGSVAWGDYDNDGRLDFLFAGFGEGDVFVSQIWRNTGTRFTNVTAAVAPGLPGLSSSSVAWGDYDNDGRLDFLLSGSSWSLGYVSELWRNTGTGFTNVTSSAAPGLVNQFHAPVAWGDYDNDGRLDLLTGRLQVWRNNTPAANTPPTAPSGLVMTATTDAVMLSWNSATDVQTPASGLTYNVRAGTTPGGNNLISAQVNSANGFRRMPALGNAMLRHSLPLIGVTNGQAVYWSVQAVDTSWAGGPFATETSVVSIPQLTITPLSGTNATVSWAPPTFGWFLQQSTNLNTPHWTPTPSGSANPAIVPATNAARFYRLANP